MKRLLVVLLLAAGMVLVNPSVALACSCAPVTPEQSTKDADTVAVGTVQWTASDGIDRTYGVRFDQVYKGLAGIEEKLVTSADEASCGLGDLAVEGSYIFFIQGKHPGQLKVGLCGGTTAYDVEVLDAVESVAGGPKEPFPSFASGPTVAADTTDPIRVIGIGAIVAAGLFGVIVLIRRRFTGHGKRNYLG